MSLTHFDNYMYLYKYLPTTEHMDGLNTQVKKAMDFTKHVVALICTCPSCIEVYIYTYMQWNESDEESTILVWDFKIITNMVVLLTFVTNLKVSDVFVPHIHV